MYTHFRGRFNSLCLGSTDTGHDATSFLQKKEWWLSDMEAVNCCENISVCDIFFFFDISFRSIRTFQTFSSSSVTKNAPWMAALLIQIFLKCLLKLYFLTHLQSQHRFAKHQLERQKVSLSGWWKFQTPKRQNQNTASLSKTSLSKEYTVILRYKTYKTENQKQ